MAVNTETIIQGTDQPDASTQTARDSGGPAKGSPFDALRAAVRNEPKAQEPGTSSTSDEATDSDGGPPGVQSVDAGQEPSERRSASRKERGAVIDERERELAEWREKHDTLAQDLETHRSKLTAAEQRQQEIREAYQATVGDDDEYLKGHARYLQLLEENRNRYLTEDEEKEIADHKARTYDRSVVEKAVPLFWDHFTGAFSGDLEHAAKDFGIGDKLPELMKSHRGQPVDTDKGGLLYHTHRLAFEAGKAASDTAYKEKVSQLETDNKALRAEKSAGARQPDRGGRPSGGPADGGKAVFDPTRSPFANLKEAVASTRDERP